ncbi:hypothetical protein XELAEV_18005984mg [Xenopus laevis]|uniref:Helix-turn-helix domain-containing protein n=1 Tax=Xenopus laevis TaxID=8355 RepID=A0A974DYP1_XENLA|nr:hypothetical protein XELAEV_18005984mg [Xenopus laevis]
MSSNVAPLYANTYMHMYETTKHILGHPLFRQYGDYYRRYIDDLFFLWYGSKEDLVNLVDDLNQIPSNIWFKVHNDPEQIQFLDVTVYKDKGNNKLQTKIYQKATDRNSLLHYTSSHPKLLLESLPKSQMMRVVRLTSEEQERNRALNHMATQFIKRGYPKRLVDNTKQWAMSLDRTATIKGDTHKKVPKTRNDTHWPIIKTDVELTAINKKKIQFGYRRNKNLKELLSPTDPVSKYNTSRMKIQKTGPFKEFLVNAVYSMIYDCIICLDLKSFQRIHKRLICSQLPMHPFLPCYSFMWETLL